jgi:hypothetical protein
MIHGVVLDNIMFCPFGPLEAPETLLLVHPALGVWLIKKVCGLTLDL